jgi:hypothetical protein
VDLYIHCSIRLSDVFNSLSTTNIYESDKFSIFRLSKLYCNNLENLDLKKSAILEHCVKKPPYIFSERFNMKMRESLILYSSRIYDFN